MLKICDRQPRDNSCVAKMNRLSAAGCQDIVSFGNQFDLNCATTLNHAQQTIAKNYTLTQTLVTNTKLCIIY